MIVLSRTAIQIEGLEKSEVQCVWCFREIVDGASILAMYSEEDDFEIEIVFCEDDHVALWLGTYDVNCVMDKVITFCKRAVQSEGYDYKTMDVDLNHVDILYDMIKDCVER